jgi:ribose transport system permease protein
MKKKEGVFKKLIVKREFNILALVVLVVIILSIATPNFLTTRNLVTLGINLSVYSILVIGMTMVLATGGVDLSIGAILGLTGMATGILHITFGLNIWLACLLSLVIAGILGAINGFMIGKVKITPLIVTLAMMGMARGLTYVITEGATVAVPNAPKLFLFLGKGKIIGVPVIIIISLVLLVVFDILMRNMIFFRKMYYLGSNEKATLLSGINVFKTKMSTYILMGLFSGIAGILTLSRFTVATPKAGIGAEMRIISACVIGGASLMGGVGTVLGSLAGLILLSVVNNGLILLDVSIYWQDFISGAILLLAVTLDQVTSRNNSK